MDVFAVASQKRDVAAPQQRDDTSRRDPMLQQGEDSDEDIHRRVEIELTNRPGFPSIRLHVNRGF